MLMRCSIGVTVIGLRFIVVPIKGYLRTRFSLFQIIMVELLGYRPLLSLFVVSYVLVWFGHRACRIEVYLCRQ